MALGGVFNSAVVQAVMDHAAVGDILIDTFVATFFGSGVSLPTTGATDSFTVQQDAGFLVYYLTGAVFQPVGTVIASPDVFVQVNSQGSGRYLSNNPMHWVSIIGDAKNPLPIPEPKIWMPAAVIQVQLTNTSGGNFAEVSLSMIGTKLFPQKNFQMSDLLRDVASGGLPVAYAYPG